MCVCVCTYVGEGERGCHSVGRCRKSMCQCKKRELNTIYGLGKKNGECICVWCVGERVKGGGG